MREFLVTTLAVALLLFLGGCLSDGDQGGGQAGKEPVDGGADSSRLEDNVFPEPDPLEGESPQDDVLEWDALEPEREQGQLQELPEALEPELAAFQEILQEGREEDVPYLIVVEN